jgi:hypothetical protein
MLNCQEVSKKVSQSMDASLPVHHRMMISVHQMMCKYCNRLRKQLMILKKAVHLEKLPEDDIARSESLSEAARERIKRAVGKVSPRFLS